MPKRGRKPKFGEAAEDELRIRVTPEQRRRLQESAKLNLTTVADLVREAVASYVADFSDDPMFEEATR
jgi:predicted DNA-binding protein